MPSHRGTPFPGSPSVNNSVTREGINLGFSLETPAESHLEILRRFSLCLNSSGCYLSYKAQDGPPISKPAPIVHSADRGRETLIQKPRAGVLAQVAVTKYHRPSDLNNSNFFSHISGGRKSKTKMLTGLVSLFGLQMASHLALFSHGQSSGHVHPWCLS